MKSLAAVLALASSLAALAGPPPVQRPPGDLRQVLQQYHPASSTPTPPPRELTPIQRAELRRQLSEYAAPVPAPSPVRRR